MTCKKCSFILYGSENYCPHCGEKCSTEETPDKQKADPEPKPIFISRDTSAEELITRNRIFGPEDNFDEATPPNRKQSRKKEKSSSRALTVFLSITCLILLFTSVFTVADHLDIVPAVADFLGQNLTTTEAVSETTEDRFSSTLGTVSPQINYAPVNCTVSSSGSISLRKGPSEAYGQVSVLPSGSTIQVIGGSAESQSWVYVYFAEEDLYGWLSASFISEELTAKK